MLTQSRTLCIPSVSHETSTRTISFKTCTQHVQHCTWQVLDWTHHKMLCVPDRAHPVAQCTHNVHDIHSCVCVQGCVQCVFFSPWVAAQGSRTQSLTRCTVYVDLTRCDCHSGGASRTRTHWNTWSRGSTVTSQWPTGRGAEVCYQRALVCSRLWSCRPTGQWPRAWRRMCVSLGHSRCEQWSVGVDLADARSPRPRQTTTHQYSVVMTSTHQYAVTATSSSYNT